MGPARPARGRVTPSRSGRPEPTAGWGLLVAFGVLVVGALVLPFASAGDGSSAEPIVSDLAAAVPLFVLAGAAVLAGLAGRQGYDVGAALGGGAVLFFSVILVLIAKVTKDLLDWAGSFGGTFTPHLGLVCALGALVVGVLAVIPALSAVARSQGQRQMPGGLALAGTIGSLVFLAATFWPQEGEDLFFGDWFIDGWLVMFFLSLLVPTIMLLAIRTGPAAALLGGVLLFPAASWVSDGLTETSSIGQESWHSYELAGIGLIVAIAVATIGTVGYAFRTEIAADGSRQHTGAGNIGLATAVAAAFGLAGMVSIGIAANEDDGPSYDDTAFDDEFYEDDWYSDTEEFYEDDQDLWALADRCEEGSMTACDELYRSTPGGSELEAIAMSCGGRDYAYEHYGDCASTAP